MGFGVFRLPPRWGSGWSWGHRCRPWDVCASVSARREAKSAKPSSLVEWENGCVVVPITIYYLSLLFIIIIVVVVVVVVIIIIMFIRIVSWTCYDYSCYHYLDPHQPSTGENGAINRRKWIWGFPQSQQPAVLTTHIPSEMVTSCETRGSNCLNRPLFCTSLYHLSTQPVFPHLPLYSGKGPTDRRQHCDGWTGSPVCRT
jgi:hypothetical protein